MKSLLTVPRPDDEDQIQMYVEEL